MSDTSQEGDSRFSPEVEAALRRGGWFPGRQIAEEEMAKWYVLRWQATPGYCRIFPAAYRFLHEFGGMHLLVDYHMSLKSGGTHSSTYRCFIDPLRTLGHQDDLWIYYEWQMETCLYPLGMWDTGDFLHIDIQGRFWSLYNTSGDPFLYGHTTEEALTNILDLRHYSSYPPKPVEWTPLDQLSDELIRRIVEAEQKAVSAKR